MDDIIRKAVDLTKSGQKAEARQLINDVLERDPRNLAALSALARASENDQEAIAVLERIVAIYPEDEWANRHLARLRRGSKGEMEEHPSMKRKPVSDEWLSAAQAQQATPADKTPAVDSGDEWNDVGWQAADAAASAPPPTGGTPAPAAQPSTSAGETTGPLEPQADAGGGSNRTLLFAGAGCLVLVVCLCVLGILGAVLFGSAGQEIAQDLIEEQLGTGPIIDEAIPSDPQDDPAVATPSTEDDPFAVTVPADGALVDDGYNTTLEETIAVGQSIEGNIVEQGAAHSYTINLEGGQALTIAVQAAEGSDPYLGVYDADGQLVAEDDDSGGDFSPLLAFTPQQSGTYTLRVRMFAGGTGLYTIIVTQGTDSAASPDQADDLPTTLEQSVALGETVTASLEEGSGHNWFLDVAGDANFTVTVNDVGGTLDPEVSVFGGDGSLLVYDDDGGEGFNSQAQVVVTGAQTVTIRVTPVSGSGEYEVIVTEN